MMLLMSKIMTNKYIKKQLPVEAVLWNGDNFEEIKEFILSKKPDEIVCEPFEDKMQCKDRFSSFYYNKGAVLYYDKKNKKDVFKYGDDCLNNYSCFGILPLGYYLYFGGNNRVFHSLKKEEFEAKYEQQDSNHNSKPSSFSLRNLVMQIAPKHIKYYIERLEEYGFKLELINEALIGDKGMYLPFIFLRDKNCNDILIVNQKGCYSMSGHRQAFELRMANKIIKNSADGTILTNDYVAFEVKNNNWREAFNKLVASFPDEIMKNTNNHASLTS